MITVKEPLGLVGLGYDKALTHQVDRSVIDL